MCVTNQHVQCTVCIARYSVISLLNGGLASSILNVINFIHFVDNQLVTQTLRRLPGVGWAFCPYVRAFDRNVEVVRPNDKHMT